MTKRCAFWHLDGDCFNFRKYQCTCGLGVKYAHDLLKEREKEQSGKNTALHLFSYSVA